MVIKNKFNFKTKWYLITIEDPAALPGNSILKVINHIKLVINFKYVILDRIDGAFISSLIEYENIPIKINTLSNLLPEVVQFDWGDFFLFKKYPSNWNNFKNERYPFVISQSDTTVRAIDDTYIYIYTPFNEIVKIIEDNYEIESIKNGLLQDLDYPE